MQYAYADSKGPNQTVHKALLPNILIPADILNDVFN